ncbi:hypothetical protein, partial [Pseudomonas sp.]|uniref:hypothetical protein n=1 Tax=Pseudomonas sp. TaxID=306 RepID=UPI0025F51D2C
NYIAEKPFTDRFVQQSPSEAKRRVDADAARTDGCSWLEIDEIAVLDALFAVLALGDEGLNCL